MYTLMIIIDIIHEIKVIKTTMMKLKAVILEASCFLINNNFLIQHTSIVPKYEFLRSVYFITSLCLFIFYI